MVLLLTVNYTELRAFAVMRLARKVALPNRPLASMRQCGRPIDSSKRQSSWGKLSEQGTPLTKSGLISVRHF